MCTRIWSDMAICIFLSVICQSCCICWSYLSKNQLFVLWIFLCFYFFFFYLLISTLYYFLISISFGFIFLFLLQHLEVEPWIVDLRCFLFANVCIPCYKFPSRYCFICVSHILICHMFTLIQLRVFFFFFFYFP